MNEVTGNKFTKPVYKRLAFTSETEREKGRAADGIDDFLEEMKNMQHVGSVERVWFEEGRKIEIYVTRGIG